MRRLITQNHQDQLGPITPHLGLRYAHQDILAVSSKSQVLQAQDYLSDQRVVDRQKIGALTIHGLYKGCPISVVSVGNTPSTISCMVPEIIEACESDTINIIQLSSVYGIKPTLQQGDFYVTERTNEIDQISQQPIDLLEIIASRFNRPDLPILARFMDRVKELYPTQDDFMSKLAAEIRKMPDRKYSPKTNYQASNMLTEMALNHLLPRQSFYRGDIEESTVSSALLGTLCAYRDLYNVIDKRNIWLSSLLIIENCKFKNPNKEQEFSKRKTEITKNQTVTGLEALVKLREVRTLDQNKPGKNKL